VAAGAAGPAAGGRGAAAGWRSLAAAIACISSYAVTTGLTLPLLSLILEARGVDPTLIGALAAAPAVAVILTAPLLPALIARAGMRRFVLACIGAELALFLLLPVLDGLAWWFLIRVLMGAAGGGLWSASEAWINEVAEDRVRGRVTALYTTAVAGSFTLGPAIIPLTGIAGWAPFAVGGAFIAAAALPILAAGALTPRFRRAPALPVLGFVRLAPTLAAAVLLAAFKDTAEMALLAVYGVRRGMEPGGAALMLTTLGLGALALQLPIGWLADHLPRRALLIGCAAGGLAGAALLPAAIGWGLGLWPLLFVWGGLLAGVYTVAMAMLGERFRGPDLVAASAAYGLLWGLGSLAGPALAGAAMDRWDPEGLPATLALACALFIVLATVRARLRRR